MDFVIFSMGRTAVQWLRRAMNLHPRILLFGGPAPFATTPDPSDWDGYFTAAKLTDYSASIWPGKVPVHFGNIHGLEPSRFVAGKLTREYRAIQLTRDPLTRIASIRARVARTDMARFPDHYRNVMEQIQASLANIGLVYPDDSLNGRLLVYACGHLVPHDSVYLRTPLKVIRYEDMFTSGAIEEMTDILTGEDWSPEALAQVALIPVVDATDKNVLSSEESDFAQKVIDAFQMRDVYQRIGYLR